MFIFQDRETHLLEFCLAVWCDNLNRYICMMFWWLLNIEENNMCVVWSCDSTTGSYMTQNLWQQSRVDNTSDMDIMFTEIGTRWTKLGHQGWTHSIRWHVNNWKLKLTLWNGMRPGCKRGSCDHSCCHTRPLGVTPSLPGQLPQRTSNLPVSEIFCKCVMLDGGKGERGVLEKGQTV